LCEFFLLALLLHEFFQGGVPLTAAVVPVQPLSLPVFVESSIAANTQTDLRHPDWFARLPDVFSLFQSIDFEGVVIIPLPVRTRIWSSLSTGVSSLSGKSSAEGKG
jgi:hypothetical protein